MTTRLLRLKVYGSQAYRRLRPTYPETAARAEAEATVDVVVDVGADGEVSKVQVARWAGFGLDDTTVATVRQMHFFRDAQWHPHTNARVTALQLFVSQQNENIEVQNEDSPFITNTFFPCASSVHFCLSASSFNELS